MILKKPDFKFKAITKLKDLETLNGQDIDDMERLTVSGVLEPDMVEYMKKSGIEIKN